MEIDFDNLTLKTESELDSLYLNGSQDFIEIELLNSTRADDSWEGKQVKVYFWLPKPDKFCSFVARDAACRIDNSKFSKHYDATEKTLTLPTTSNIFFENFILEILGVINESNKIYDKPNCFNFKNAENVFKIEKENSYLNYLLRNIEILQENLKPNDTPKLKAILEQMGIFIEKNIFDLIEKKILNERKILIPFAGGNNFWFKSESSLVAGNITYHLKLNNYSYIYINKDLVEKFFLRIGQHPRCCVGVISSMTKKNLEKIINTMKAEVYNSSINIEIEYLFDQEANEAYEKEDAEGGKAFRRSLEKINEKTKNFFNSINTVFVESEIDKADKIKDNLVFLHSFSEEILQKDAEERKSIEANVDELFDYLEKLLNECDGDVREYLTRNPFKKL